MTKLATLLFWWLSATPSGKSKNISMNESDHEIRKSLDEITEGCDVINESKDHVEIHSLVDSVLFRIKQIGEKHKHSSR